jgi:hypothetical protein
MIEREVNMNKKELVMNIANLAEHCNNYSSCNGCELSIDSKKCMLRHLSLPEVIMKMSIPRKRQAVWIKFDNKPKIMESLEDIKDIAMKNNGSIPIHLYANEENLIKDLGNYYLINDTGIKILTEKFGESNVKVEDTVKGA